MNLFLVFALIILQPTEGVSKTYKRDRSVPFRDRISIDLHLSSWETHLRRFEESTWERICTKKNGSNCCIGYVAKDIVKGTRFINHLPQKSSIPIRIQSIPYSVNSIAYTV